MEFATGRRMQRVFHPGQNRTRRHNSNQLGGSQFGLEVLWFSLREPVAKTMASCPNGC